jgi:hypothetical protein
MVREKMEVVPNNGRMTIQAIFELSRRLATNVFEREIAGRACAVSSVATDALLLDLHKIPAFVSLPVSDRFGGIAGRFRRT